MRNLEGLNDEPAEPEGVAGRRFLDMPGKTPGQGRGAGKKRLERRIKLGFETCRPDQPQRPRPLCHELAVEQQERQTAEMIAMQVRDYDRIDLIAGKSEFLEGGDGSRAEIDQDCRAIRINPDAGMGASPCRESIPRSDNRNFHAWPDRPIFQGNAQFSSITPFGGNRRWLAYVSWAILSRLCANAPLMHYP